MGSRRKQRRRNYSWAVTEPLKEVRMGNEEKINGTLQERVEKREAFLTKILQFVESVVLHHGATTKREELSDHMNVDMELKDFGEFDILWHQGRCNSINIFHHTGEKSVRPVFSLNYWHSGVEACQVVHFLEEAKWPKLFTFVMENASHILSQKQGAETSKRDSGARAKEQEEAQAALLKKARRLGLM